MPTPISYPREWVGGLHRPPVAIDDPGGPTQPWLAAWMELPSRVVLAVELAAPGERDRALDRCLQKALREPQVGPPREPDRLRVDSELLAHQLTRAAGRRWPVIVAPTPELDDFFGGLADHLARRGGDPGYLQGGRLEPDELRPFFGAARLLHDLAPWEEFHEEPLLRVDCPELGLAGACVTLMGTRGEHRGLMLFSGEEAWENTMLFGEVLEPGDMQLGGEWCSVHFEPRDELSPGMRRELDEHDFDLASPDACPVVMRSRDDGALVPPTAADYHRLAWVLRGFCSFFLRQGPGLDDEDNPSCGVVRVDEELALRFTAPYEDWPGFDANEPIRDSVWEDLEQEGVELGVGEPLEQCRAFPDHDLPGPLSPPTWGVVEPLCVERLEDLADERFGEEWHAHEADFHGLEGEWMLARPWSVYGFPVRGHPVVEHFLRDPGLAGSLGRAAREWLEAQAAAWLSMWEVVGREPGQRIRICDRLSGECRVVDDPSPDRPCPVGMVLLGRVVDHGGESRFCGLHPRGFPDVAADEIERRARGRLRRKRHVPVDRLRDGEFGRYLLRRWGEFAAALDRRMGEGS